MKDETDIFKIISDYMKGKTGPPDSEIAAISFEGDASSEMLRPPELSATFSEFSEEYKIVANGLSRCSLSNCLAIFGSMLTLPEFQSNTYRIELLIHLALLHAKGKTGPTEAQVTAWFNQLDEGTCGRLEDPAEDVFLSRVLWGGGNYRTFEGLAEGNAFHTQLFLDILEDMPDSGFYADLKAAVDALLCLSEAIAERTGLPDFIVGETIPRSKIEKPGSDVWRELRKRVHFSHDELSAMGIELNTIEPFLVDTEIIKTLPETLPDISPIHLTPIFTTKKGIFVFLPSLIGTSIRGFVIQQCVNSGMADSLHQALANAYASHFSRQSFLGMAAPRIEMKKYQDFYACQLVREVDVGRYIHLIFYVDSFNHYTNTGFSGLPPIEEISSFICRSINHVHDEYSRKPRFREGLTLVIGCGWGRSLGAGLDEDPPNWRTEMIPAHDATALSRAPSFSALDIFRILDAHRALLGQEIELHYANGLLNLYGWVQNNNGHLIPHDKIKNDGNDENRPLFFRIPMNSNLNIRHDVYRSADIRRLTRTDGSVAEIQRAHSTPRYGTNELSPFYVDVDAFSQSIYRSVYIGENGIYWIEAETKPNLDNTTRYQLSTMAMHWGELVFTNIDQAHILGSNVCVACVLRFLDSELPTGDQAIPNSEDISTFVECRSKSANGTVVFDIKSGFLSTGRRLDNLGERAVVRAIVESCFAGAACSPEEHVLSDIVDKVVVSDTARHMHAFSVPQLRDYVRDDIPSRPVTITRIDDASTRLGLAWRCRNRSGETHILGLNECKVFLRELVDALVQEIKVRVSRFDKATLIESLLRNHEALFAEMDTWKRTYGAMEALSTDESTIAQEAITKVGGLNAASMSSRIVVEAAVCHSPDGGGITPGEYDIGELLAYGSLLHHMGGYSVAMSAGMMPAEIKISVAGEVMMNHEFSDDVIRPFGQFFQESSLKDAADKYEENYGANFGEKEVRTTDGDDAGIDERFESAWREEFGFTLYDLQTFVDGFHSILASDRKAVLHIKRVQLIEKIGDLTGLESEVIKACFDQFSLMPRDKWDEAPPEFMSTAWYPWQFQRQLSLVSRPIVRLDNTDDPNCLIAPAMIIMHIAKFVSDAAGGGLDQQMFRSNGPMFRWMGIIKGEQGEAFNDEVAERFRNAGWSARSNLSDGVLLDREKDPAFGDVDVIAWNASEQRVLIIECKDLSFDKTLGEIAKRLSNYRGETKENGKGKRRRDELKKHLDRCDAIENNLGELSKFVGFEVTGIEKVLAFREPTAIQYARVIREKGVKIVTFRDIEAEYGIHNRG
ncbi:hypothetical protein [Amorphus orientalis]|uniref:Uncharacterized protein n=1 Tax=Amorphus orientalis TaxID=649198 RepID=A0AAE3VMC8_9HYPH|nr:hypothetical protein [Amorphus orientalis]MDQ0314602.1 hypothetical protein [Amorphus orientalis]